MQTFLEKMIMCIFYIFIFMFKFARWIVKSTIWLIVMLFNNKEQV